MPFTSVLAEIETSEMEDESKVAVSEGPLGTLIGDQLGAVFQSPLTGEVSQLPLPPKAEPPPKNMTMVAIEKMACAKKRSGEAWFSRTELVA
jgi:hypothetical protein